MNLRSFCLSPEIIHSFLRSATLQEIDDQLPIVLEPVLDTRRILPPIYELPDLRIFYVETLFGVPTSIEFRVETDGGLTLLRSVRHHQFSCLAA